MIGWPAGTGSVSVAARRHAAATRARWGGARPLLGAAIGLLVVTVLSGCGPRNPFPTRPAWESLPQGSPLRSRTLQESDAWLRHFVMFGRHAEAREALERGTALAPGDRLLLALQRGVALHEAGEYALSNAALEWAEIEADRRFTRSMSRELASILVSDRVLAYTPAAAELALIPYYRMLNYLALGEGDGALVEARKANALMGRLDRIGGRCHIEGMLQYLAGLVQQSAGETNDALVSLRLAERALADCGTAESGAGPLVASDLIRAARTAGLVELADSVADRWDMPRALAGRAVGGDVLLVLEQGFVAHRAQHDVHIPIPRGDLKDLDGSDESGLARLAGAITTELMLGPDSRRHHARRYRMARSGWVDALDGAYILRLAWPAFRLEANSAQDVRIMIGGTESAPVQMANLSVAMREELARERPEMLTRLVLRGLSKYLISREVEDAVEEKHGDAAGFIVGRLANLAGNQLERADTRSWSLLPDRISVMRLTLPEGSHRVTLEVVEEGGGVRMVDIGPVEVRSGKLTVVRERVWAGESENRWGEVFDAAAPWEVWDEEPSDDDAAPALAVDSAATGG